MPSMNKEFSLNEVSQLGLALAEFSRRSQVSTHTLRRMNAGDPNVRESTWVRVKNTIAAIKAEMQPPAKPYRASASRA
jgi:predicted transcriptional regulator